MYRYRYIDIDDIETDISSATSQWMTDDVPRLASFILKPIMIALSTIPHELSVAL